MEVGGEGSGVQIVLDGLLGSDEVEDVEGGDVGHEQCQRGSGQDPPRSPDVEVEQRYRAAGAGLGEQQAGDQESRQDEEHVDPDEPARRKLTPAWPSTTRSTARARSPWMSRRCENAAGAAIGAGCVACGGFVQGDARARPATPSRRRDTGRLPAPNVARSGRRTRCRGSACGPLATCTSSLGTSIARAPGRLHRGRHRSGRAQLRRRG